jgi:hypothetical protein
MSLAHPAAEGARAGDGEDLAGLIKSHEAIDWADVPGVSPAEAGAWVARLIEAHEAAESEAPGGSQ